MQYRVTCSQCYRMFAMDVPNGPVADVICPYCGKKIMVATPMTLSANIATKHSREVALKASSSFRKKIALGFLLVAFAFLFLFPFLFTVFTSMS